MAQSSTDHNEALLAQLARDAEAAKRAADAHRASQQQGGR